jgi:hypothetical protein
MNTFQAGSCKGGSGFEAGTSLNKQKVSPLEPMQKLSFDAKYIIVLLSVI